MDCGVSGVSFFRFFIFLTLSESLLLVLAALHQQCYRGQGAPYIARIGRLS
jgi:hypothetical protein